MYSGFYLSGLYVTLLVDYPSSIFAFSFSKVASHTQSFMFVISHSKPCNTFFSQFVILSRVVQYCGPKPSFHIPGMDATHLYKGTGK